MRWHHEECLKAKNDTFENVWNCSSCQKMPSQIAYLVQHVTNFVNDMNIVKSAHEQSKAAVLKSEVNDLKNKLNQMTHETPRNTAMHPRSEPTPSRKRTPIIGDSIIRDIAEGVVAGYSRHPVHPGSVYYTRSQAIWNCNPFHEIAL
jgi:hypothetical protein